MARYPKKVNPYHNSDEIIGQKLFEPRFRIHLFKKVFKMDQRLRLRFAHELQHGWCGMLRRDFQLAGDMVLHQLAQIRCTIIFIRQNQVMSDAGGDKYFFDAWNLAKALQQANLPRMIGFQRGTGLRIQALFVGAGAPHLFE